MVCFYELCIRTSSHDQLIMQELVHACSSLLEKEVCLSCSNAIDNNQGEEAQFLILFSIMYHIAVHVSYKNQWCYSRVGVHDNIIIIINFFNAYTDNICNMIDTKANKCGL